MLLGSRDRWEVECRALVGRVGRQRPGGVGICGFAPLPEQSMKAFDG